LRCRPGGRTGRRTDVRRVGARGLHRSSPPAFCAARAQGARGKAAFARWTATSGRG
jgi:hypothetical protein